MRACSWVAGGFQGKSAGSRIVRWFRGQFGDPAVLDLQDDQAIIILRGDVQMAIAINEVVRASVGIGKGVGTSWPIPPGRACWVRSPCASGTCSAARMPAGVGKEREDEGMKRATRGMGSV